MRARVAVALVLGVGLLAFASGAGAGEALQVDPALRAYAAAQGRRMIRRVSHVPAWIMQLLVLLLLLFLLLPVGALFGLGLYYTLGILLVADTSQMMAALSKEAGIVPALLHTPLIAIAVSILATGWGLALSMLWRNWIAGRRYIPLLLSALPFLLPRFGLGALFLLACLKLAQWGGNALGLGLVALSQAAVAAPLVAAILCIGWRRVDPAWGDYLGRLLLQPGAASQELASGCPGGCLQKMVAQYARHDGWADRSYLDC